MFALRFLTALDCRMLEGSEGGAIGGERDGTRDVRHASYALRGVFSRLDKIERNSRWLKDELRERGSGVGSTGRTCWS